MIIDVHGHVSLPDELYVYKANLLAHRGAHGRGGVRVSDDQLRAAMQAPNHSFGGISHFEHIDAAGIDVQFISPRPFHMMHSESAQLVKWFTEETNNLIYRVCKLYPTRFRGVAGLPQSPELQPAQWVSELRRTVQEMKFVGCLLNPDPFEGTGHPPALGDHYWYPLYEALCELDIPAFIHSAGCRPPARETYSLHFIIEETIAVASLLSSEVFKDFPSLQIVVCHGGGAIPYQAGRFMPDAARNPANQPFIERLRALWFDTCLYTQDSLELLLHTVGTDRCLFGSEKPGTGSQRNPQNGRWFDDIQLLIQDIDWLTDSEREQVLHRNASELFKL